MVGKNACHGGSNCRRPVDPQQAYDWRQHQQTRDISVVLSYLSSLTKYAHGVSLIGREAHTRPKSRLQCCEEPTLKGTCAKHVLPADKRYPAAVCQDPAWSQKVLCNTLTCSCEYHWQSIKNEGKSPQSSVQQRDRASDHGCMFPQW